MSNLKLRVACSMLAFVALETEASGSHPCADIVEPASRLACYDEAFPPPRSVEEAASKKALDDFGFRPSQEPLRNPGQTAMEADPGRIESRVSKVDYHSGGNRTITLENGQVWRLTDVTSSGHMEVGDVVVLRKGLMGGFLLSTRAGVSLRVRRVR